MARLEWADLTDGTIGQLREERALLVLASRKLSSNRIGQLLKEYLKKSNVVFGIADEPFVKGFENQPQFTTLREADIAPFEAKVTAANSVRTLTLLRYPQSQTDNVIRAVRPSRVIVVRGSYQYVFHRSSTHALLTKRGIPFELISPFSSEQEAHDYLARTEPNLPHSHLSRGKVAEIFQLVDQIAAHSFDYSFQTGAVLARRGSNGRYTVLDAACNEVVPYQTYALHFGNAREIHQSAFQDASHYDTIHAEMNLLARAARTDTSINDASLFINLLPCPNCARTLCKSGITEVVYQKTHSDGYAQELFEKCGIKTRGI